MEPLLIVRISSSPWLLFLTFLGMTLLLHVAFVWLLPLKDTTLKYIDYGWLFIAAIGVFAASAKGGQFIALNQLKFQEPATQNAYDFLRHDINAFMQIACLPRQRSSFSPPDFDDIFRAEQQMCAQYEKLDAEMPTTVQPPFHPLSELNFRPVTANPKFSEYFKSDISRLNLDIAFYEKTLAIYQELVKERDASEFEDTYKLLGPLLLALAIAIRVVKTSGEIMNAKRRAQSAV